MENTNTLLFEMRVLNELRKLKPEQRKEIIDTIEREEKLEEEAIKKNPNLHLENKIQQVITELKDMRNELQILKENNKKCTLSLESPTYSSCLRNLNNDCEEESESSLFTFDWWPIFLFIFIFLTILSIPGKSSRPSPFSIP
jgi:hypothetical protein